MSDQIYQFKITLRDVKPAIWRQIQVPEYYTFWDLHVAIQDAMGWSDSHLHLFSVGPAFTPGSTGIGIPMEDGPGKTIPCWSVPIEENFTEKEPDMEYLYDFGDSWVHDIVLEKILSMKNKETYPRCIAGERACPPDDCGGTYGYQELVEATDPKHDRHDELKDWLGGVYDPEAFDAKKVKFDDSEKRWERAFGTPDFI